MDYQKLKPLEEWWGRLLKRFVKEPHLPADRAQALGHIMLLMTSGTERALVARATGHGDLTPQDWATLALTLVWHLARSHKPVELPPVSPEEIATLDRPATLTTKWPEAIFMFEGPPTVH